MRKWMIFLLLGLGSTHFGWSQDVYSVTTLLPQDSRLIDDGLSLDENGNLYGSYWGIWQGEPGRHLLRYRPDGSYDTLAMGLSRPNGVSYANGKVYIANSASGEVVVVDTLGTKTLLAQIPGGVSNAVPVPGTDSLLLVAWGKKQILSLRPNGSLITLTQSNLLNGAVGACFDGEGNFFIGNFNDGKILKWDGTEVTELINLGGGIGFLTYSAADSALLVTNHTDKKVYHVSLPDGIATVIAGSGTPVIQDGIGLQASFMSPNGIAATPTGDTIYVSEFAGKALRRMIRVPNSVDVRESVTSRLRLYPLPSHGRLTIENLDPAQVEQAVLQDSSGKTLRTFSQRELASQFLNLEGIPRGTYLLNFLNKAEETVATFKIPLRK